MKIASLLFLLVGAPPLEDRDALAYPTFEPFVASRMFKLFGDPARADLEQLAQKIGSFAQANASAKEAAEELGPPEESKLSALLEPEIPAELRVVAPLVPVALMKIEPLWTASQWTSAQVADARAVSGLVARIPDAPSLVFAEGKHAENRAALETLVRWFHAQVASPEWYAAMIYTWDDGPYAGLVHEADLPLAAQSVQALDEKTELRLCRVERPNEPWVLQAVRDGKALWSRVISAAPDESISAASFAEEPLLRVGPYGWKVRLVVGWSGGEELSEVFLDPQGNLLFYFLSW